MLVTFGQDYFEARHNRKAPVRMDTSRLINGHVLLVGSSGVGKSYTIRNMIRQAVASMGGKKVRFHVFDVHGDLEVPGASVVQFSEHAPYGLNPFRVDPDVHFGGVRKVIQSFIRTVDLASSTKLGLKQEAVIRNILYDVFREFGFHENDPTTWSLNEYESRLVSGGADNRLYLTVPMGDKERAKALGARWDPDKKLWWVHTQNYTGGLTEWPAAFKARTYPTLADVVAYAKRLHEERFLGSDQGAVRALTELHRRAQAFQRKMLQAVRENRYKGTDNISDETLDAAREKALDAFENYVNSVQTGEELSNLIKYESPDVLKSVLDRLTNLLHTGIYKSAAPPFDPDTVVWRYKLNALLNEEKKMFVLFSLQDIFYKAVQRGEQSDVVEVVVLDELGTYTSSADDDSGDGIIGVIAREARKFGLALWGAHQQPTGVPESLISSVATKIVLGLDERYWQAAVTKLRIEDKLLNWIQPHHTLAVQMKEKGALKNRWWWVQLDG